MKKILLSIIAVASMLSSCRSFIEHDVRGSQTLDNYFQTAEECENFVNDLYKRALMHYDWYQIIAGRMANESATDDAWMGNTGQDASDMSPMAQFLINPNRMGYMADQYKMRYENVASCNLAIEGIQKAQIRDDLKTRYMGEALFMRAYNYYELVNNFGGVPLVLKPLSTSDLTMTRSTAEEVYAQIEKDLLDAFEMLPGSFGAKDKGRATKWTSYALLARVCLFEGKWQEAFDYSDAVIRNGGYTLEPNFINLFSVNNHNGVESILEAQTSSVSDKSLGNQICTFVGPRGESKDNFPSGDSKDVMDGWGWCVPTSDLENCYLSENDEIRRKSTITVSGDPAYGDEVLNPTHIFDVKQNKSGRIIRKFYLPVASRRSVVDKRYNAPLNTPIIRLAEMYLTRAEALYHLNQPDLAMDDVDFVRNRVNLTAKKGLVSGTDVLYAIWKERRMELAFEGIRLYDIRRQIDPATNKPMIATLMGPQGTFVLYNTTISTDKYETTNRGELQDKGVNFDITKHLVWPLPQSEIDRSNGLIKQNPNY